MPDGVSEAPAPDLEGLIRETHDRLLGPVTRSIGDHLRAMASEVARLTRVPLEEENALGWRQAAEYEGWLRSADVETLKVRQELAEAERKLAEVTQANASLEGLLLKEREFRAERLGSLPSDLRGDGPCSGCGTFDNIVWFTESVFWNNVIRAEGSRWHQNEPILCVNCFVTEADRMGFKPTGYRLLPEWPWRHAARAQEDARESGASQGKGGD